MSPYPLDIAIADLAGEYIRRCRAQGITLDTPDAIIGATAVHHGLVFVTYRVRRKCLGFPKSPKAIWTKRNEVGNPVLTDPQGKRPKGAQSWPVPSRMSHVARGDDGEV